MALNADCLRVRPRICVGDSPDVQRRVEKRPSRRVHTSEIVSSSLTPATQRIPSLSEVAMLPRLDEGSMPEENALTMGEWVQHTGYNPQTRSYCFDIEQGNAAIAGAHVEMAWPGSENLN